MKPLAQQQQVRLFRRLGYWTVAAALLPLLWQHPTWFGTVGCCYLLSAPLLYEWLAPSSVDSGRNLLELPFALLLGAIVVRLDPGYFLSICVLSTYLLCQLADAGLRRIALVSVPLLATVLLAWIGRPLLQATVVSQSDSEWWLAQLWALQWAWVLCAVLLFFMALAFTYIGHSRSVRLYQAKQKLQRQSQQLALVNQRLARYLPAELPARVQQAPSTRLRLQRRWLSMVFIDLCNFSASTRALQAEALAIVLNDYLSMLNRQCQRVQGSLSKVVGDGALVVFELPDPAAQAATARRAVALCEALPLALARLHQDWQRQGLLPQLQCRAGLASGYCSIGDWGRERLDYTVIGDAVNLAARLQQHAEPGRVLLDNVSATLVAEQVALAPPRNLTLKGFGAQAVYALLATHSVDPAKGSAMVPSVSAVLAGDQSPSSAASDQTLENPLKRANDSGQVVSASVSGRAH